MTSTLSRALSALNERKDEILALTEAMVRINSYTTNVAGVDEVGYVLREALSRLPLTCEVHAAAGFGAHLCFRSQAALAEPAVLLIGHHDTVFPAGAFERYERIGDIARGPGVLDMKSGLALVVTVLCALADADSLSTLPIAFVSVSDEEVGSPSSRAWLEGIARSARLGLVFEAGRAGDAIITSRRGSGNAVVDMHGRAAHAGNALSEGKSAIWALARFIDRAQALTDVARGISVNVGLIRGGTAKNTVADFARGEADLRFLDPEGERALCAALERAAHEAAASVPGTRSNVRIDISRKPWTRSAENAALCARYGACQRAAGLMADEAPRAGGGSDANTVATVGLPVIDGLGARGAGFHTLDEHIEISSLHPKAEALLRFLLSELAPAAAEQVAETSAPPPGGEQE